MEIDSYCKERKREYEDFTSNFGGSFKKLKEDTNSQTNAKSLMSYGLTNFFLFFFI